MLGNDLVGLAGMAAYTTAEHDVIGLPRAVALERAESSIRVNAVAPGYVATLRLLESEPTWSTGWLLCIP